MVPPENGKTSLLAEDEQPVRTFVLAMLEANGYNVITAVDGQDALEKSRQFQGTIHLMLSDVQMPNMTGVELAAQIQIDRPDIRVLLVSGMAAGMLLLNEATKAGNFYPNRSCAGSCKKESNICCWIECETRRKRQKLLALPVALSKRNSANATFASILSISISSGRYEAMRRLGERID